MKTKLSLMAAALALAACSPALTIPVNGVSDDAEAWRGQATNFTGDAYGGTLELRSDRGRVCSGVYRYQADMITGNASLTCSDGATGAIAFKSGGWSGKGAGAGTIGGRPVRIGF
jgi:hypothetical protein